MHTTSSLFSASSLIFWGSLALSICHKKKICQNVHAGTIKLQVQSKVCWWKEKLISRENNFMAVRNWNKKLKWQPILNQMQSLIQQLILTHYGYFTSQYTIMLIQTIWYYKIKQCIKMPVWQHFKIKVIFPLVAIRNNLSYTFFAIGRWMVFL